MLKPWVTILEKVGPSTHIPSLLQLFKHSIFPSVSFPELKRTKSIELLICSELYPHRWFWGGKDVWGNKATLITSYTWEAYFMGSALRSPPTEGWVLWFRKINLLCQAWWYVPLILAVRRLQQESKLKASLSYMVTFKLTWAIWDPFSRGKKGAKKIHCPLFRFL